MSEKFDFDQLFQPLDVTDGWANLITGMGVRGRDKAEDMRYFGRKALGFDELDELYSYDGMSAKLVDDIVEDAFRCGWKLKFSVDGEGIDADKANDINSRISDWHKSSGYLVHAEHQAKFVRAYGGSLLIHGADDGGEPWEPLDESRVNSFGWLRPVDRFQVSAGHEIDGDPASPGYGFPIHYKVASILPAQADGGDSSWAMSTLTVHNSRVFRGDGVWVSDRMRQRNDGWGQSVIERCYDPLRHWNAMNKSVGTLVQDFSQGVYGVKGLVSQLASDKGPLLNRFRTMDMVRSSVNAILIDADGESFERKTTSLTGLPEVMTHGQQWLSAVSGSPMTKLFGISPGGFGTGESEGENWDDKVKAWQDKFLRPMLEHAYRLLFLTPEFKDVPESWSIEFAPLQLESPDKTADIRLKNAQADNIYMTHGSLGPRSEVAVSRFGGEKYGQDIELSEDDEFDDEVQDEAMRRNLEAEGGADESGGQGHDSAQLASLRSLMEDVKGGMDIDAVVAAAIFAFPTMSESQARAIFSPLAKQAESAPKRPVPDALKDNASSAPVEVEDEQS